MPRYTAVVDFEVIKRVLAAFEREGVKYAIFGGAALNLHGLEADAALLKERFQLEDS